MRVYGRNIAKEIVNNNVKVQKAYIGESFKDEYVISYLQKQKVDIKYLTKNELLPFEKENHQGIILTIPDFEFSEIDEMLNAREKPFLVILDHLNDTHNFGAIIRTCEAAGVDGIIIPKNRSVDINETVMKTSSGALLNMKIAKVNNLNQTIESLKEQGFWFVGTDMDGKQAYDEQEYDMKLALIIGSEGFGMGKSIKEACDFLVSIPMAGKINSLNASVAAGIVIYQVISKRK